MSIVVTPLELSDHPFVNPVRRRVLLATSMMLAGCASPLPLGVTVSDEPAAHARLLESAQAHGLDAYRRITDVNVSYEGQWRPLIGRIQPELIDPGFRVSSEERLLPSQGFVGQRHRGPLGFKQVAWRHGQGGADLGSVQVWINDVPSQDADRLQTGALVAAGYCLFLLGPLWLVGQSMPLRMMGSASVDGRDCDVIEAWLSPGLGRVATDRLLIDIDRDEHLMRRVRFTLEGFDKTRGAVAEVECYDHQRRDGVSWPTRFYERLKHPFPLPVHDWRLTGLDVDRGYALADISGPQFLSRAASPARGLG